MQCDLACIEVTHKLFCFQLLKLERKRNEKNALNCWHFSAFVTTKSDLSSAKNVKFAGIFIKNSMYVYMSPFKLSTKKFTWNVKYCQYVFSDKFLKER